MTEVERRILIESGLFDIASWAAVINEVPGEARGVLSQALHGSDIGEIAALGGVD